MENLKFKAPLDYFIFVRGVDHTDSFFFFFTHNLLISSKMKYTFIVFRYMGDFRGATSKNMRPSTI